MNPRPPLANALKLIVLLPIVAVMVAALLLGPEGSPMALAATQPGVTPQSAAPAAQPAQSRIADPFAYCASVGTIDAPDARYSGEQTPPQIARSVRDALDLPDAPPSAANAASPASGASATPKIVWRCVGGKVYACDMGSDTPCTQKANLERTGNPAMISFCQANPDNEMIPASITGRTTVYQWRCANGAPTVIKQFARADSQGYLSHYWVEISPQGQ